MDNCDDFIDYYTGYMGQVEQALEQGMENYSIILSMRLLYLAVGHYMNHVRVNEPYLIYTEQERL